MSKRRDPVVLDLEETPIPEAPDADETAQEQGLDPAAERMLAGTGRRRLSGIGRLAWGCLAGLVLLWGGLGVHDFVTGLLAARPWAGWLALALAVGLGVGVVLLVLKELAALARQRRSDRLRQRAQAAWDGGSAKALEDTLAGLNRLFAARQEIEPARTRLRAAQADTPDAGAMLGIAEREILAPLDRRAEAAAAASARAVAAVTAFLPMALVDMLAVLLINLRMIRNVAEIYEGRSGWLGSWRLLRAIATHLAATGAISATDDLLGPLVGGGVVAKVSRRFGEAAVNAALTARIGAAAIEVCRPMPFVACPAPRARSIVVQALGDWRGPKPAG
jgi:putative membrane protein